MVATVAIGQSRAIRLPFGECKESIYDGPLASHTPLKYRPNLRFESGHKVEVEIQVKADYKDSDEPRNVIVLHADKSLQVYSVGVKILVEKQAFIPAYVYYDQPQSLPIESVCRDSAKQLLVIKLKTKLSDSFFVTLNARAPFREDQKGLYKVGNGEMIKVNFGNSQARYIMPCFDEPKYKALFEIHMDTYYHYGDKSDRIQAYGDEFNPGEEDPGQRMILGGGQISMNDLWFDLKR